MVLISTIEYGGIKLEIYAEDNGAGGTNFEIRNVGDPTANFDILGFFVDVDNDGGLIKYSDDKANNMNGSAADGTKLDGFDYAETLGTVGGNDTDYKSGFFTIADLAFEDLDGAQIGLRLTSVGPDREDSLKLVGDVEIPEEPDNFPEVSQNISNIVLYFNTTDGDVKPMNPPPGPTGDGDGYYTVKIDNVPGTASDDLDDWLDDVLAYLIANDPNVDADTELLGVHIKYGTNIEFYAMDGDPDVDDISEHTTLTDVVTNNAIDQSYDYTTELYA